MQPSARAVVHEFAACIGIHRPWPWCLCELHRRSATASCARVLLHLLKSFPLAASSGPQPLKRRDSPATVQPRNTSAALESALRFNTQAAHIRSSSTEWNDWAFPLTPEQKAQKEAALHQARAERRLRSRQAASYGVFEFARRTDGWMAKCCRYKEVGFGA
jgi:hypothetical protein